MGRLKCLRNIILCIVFLLFGTTVCFAQSFYMASNDPMAYVVTGTIEKIGRNVLEIRDEEDKALKRFVYFSEDVQVGDRVRAHYDPVSRRILLLKKMTRLEYKKEGQNLGYIVQQERKP